VQAALLQLGTTISDTRRMNGANENQGGPGKAHNRQRNALGWQS
jgi:hypothetical protein